MTDPDRQEETRLLVTTFIVATLIAYMQLDTNKIDSWLWISMGVLILPLVAAAGFAFLFIMVQGLALETFMLEVRHRQLLRRMGRVLYSMSVICYMVTMPAFLLAVGLFRIIAHFIDGSIPLWPGYLIVTILLLVSIFITITSYIRASLTYHKKVYQRLVRTGILYRWLYLQDENE
jgi:hypothetical protein